MDRTEQVRRAQALYKERKKQKNECRVELHLSKSAYEALLSGTQETCMTRSMYVTRLLEGVEIQKMPPVLSSPQTDGCLSPSSPSLPVELTELAEMKVKLQKLQMENQNKDYWVGRLTEVNESLQKTIREMREALARCRCQPGLPPPPSSPEKEF